MFFLYIVNCQICKIQFKCPADHLLKKSFRMRYSNLGLSFCWTLPLKRQFHQISQVPLRGTLHRAMCNFSNFAELFQLEMDMYSGVARTGEFTLINWKILKLPSVVLGSSKRLALEIFFKVDQHIKAIFPNINFSDQLPSVFNTRVSKLLII